MHFALLAHGLPQPSSNGGPMTCWAIMNQMLASGHRVTAVSLRYPNASFAEMERQQVIRDQGAGLILVNTDEDEATHLGSDTHHNGLGPKLGRLLWPDPAHVFGTAHLGFRMGAVLEEISPDAVFVYHWDTLATTHGLRVAPRMAGVGDPWHLPGLRRWQQVAPRPSLDYLKWSLATLRGLYVYPKSMVELLNDCETSGCFQAQAAEWLRRKGAVGCRYLRSPVVDACGSQWLELRNAAPPRDKPKILLGPSNLEATSTSAGIRLFATEILPRLEHQLGADGFEVHVVGEGKPPAELARVLPHPSVVLRGRVEPADNEFLSSDIQLVPTPFVLGIRLRIVTGFSFGCCVVAHTNEVVNIPEMAHERNALLASDGRGLAEAIIRAVRDPALRQRLGANARKTYEENFHPRVAAARIVAEMERLGRERRA